MLWALMRFDLYAPGLERVGLGPPRSFTRKVERMPTCWRWPKTFFAMGRWPVLSRK